MSYAMRWILRVEPEPGELRDLTAELCWPDSSRKSAPDLRSMRGECGEVWSWYQADDDMLALSARFPSLLFVLEVHNAEEPGLYAPERWYFKAEIARVSRNSACVILRHVVSLYS